MRARRVRPMVWRRGRWPGLQIFGPVPIGEPTRGLNWSTWPNTTILERYQAARHVLPGEGSPSCGFGLDAGEGHSTHSM